MAQVSTIDVAGVRALHDRHGARVAGKLLLRACRERPTQTALEELKNAGGNLSVSKGHASLWTPLGPGERGRIRISGAQATIEDDTLDLPDTVLAALVGGPLTRLVQHPVLDDGMTITKAEAAGGFVFLKIRGTARPLRETIDVLGKGGRP